MPLVVGIKQACSVCPASWACLKYDKFAKGNRVFYQDGNYSTCGLRDENNRLLCCKKRTTCTFDGFCRECTDEDNDKFEAEE